MKAHNLLIAVVLLGGCKGGNDYAAMAKAANAARADGGNEDLLPVPANATLLAHSQNHPRGLQLVGNTVYWLNAGGRTVGKKGVFSASSSGGGNVTTLMASDADVMAMGADATHAYFLAPREGRVFKVANNGGIPEELAATTDISRGLVIDEANVYWAENAGIYRVPKAGGKPALVTEAGIPDVLQVDESHVYWYSTLAGVISRAPKKGGAASKVHADDKHTLHMFLVDGPDVFVSYGANEKMVIEKVPKGGGTPVKIAEGQIPGADFAADANFVYWITEDDIFKVPRNGGPVSKVVAKIAHGKDIAVDGQYVYWADRTRVNRMPK